MTKVAWSDDADLGEEALKCHPVYHGKTCYYGESAYRESMVTEESKDQAKSFEAKVQSMYSSSSTVKYSQAFSGRSRSIALVKDYFEALLDIAKLGKSAGYKPTEPSEKAMFKLWNQKKDGKGDLVVLRLERGKGKGLKDFVQKIQKKIQDVQEKAGGPRFAVLCASGTEGTSSMDPLKFKQQLDSQDKSFLKVRLFFKLIDRGRVLHPDCLLCRRRALLTLAVLPAPSFFVKNLRKYTCSLLAQFSN